MLKSQKQNKKKHICFKIKKKACLKNLVLWWEIIPQFWTKAFSMQSFREHEISLILCGTTVQSDFFSHSDTKEPTSIQSCNTGFAKGMCGTESPVLKNCSWCEFRQTASAAVLAFQYSIDVVSFSQERWNQAFSYSLSGPKDT
ncbi:hypothetical protein CHARACLAT_021507 [Characodon lateralis]|uniref:Uncharacterized protein n=1 Tax=Characodon lateralis TaxID=208331 RepID=A0ABU7D9K1_9TELE|nr:hypothetical protein [Characodon lateralis]